MNSGLITLGKGVIATICGSLVIDAIYLGVRYVLQKKRPKIKALNPRSEVLFFTEEGGKCFIDQTHKAQTCTAEHCPLRHERKIIGALLAAKSSIDVCIFNLNHEVLEFALKHAIGKRIKVRIVTDANKAGKDGSSIAKLRSWGAFVEEKSCEPNQPVTFTVTELHMHHKFAIVDGCTLLTGSINWTSRAFKGNWDNMLITSDRCIVNQFQEEFEYLFSTHDKDVPVESSPKTCPTTSRAFNLHKKLLSDVSVATFYRREGLNCRPHINRKIPCLRQPCSLLQFTSFLDMLKSTTTSLVVCSNQFTLEDYSVVIIALKEKGVPIRFVCDRKMAPGSGSQVQRLLDAGVEVRMRPSDSVMHHKWIIIDSQIIITGSLNWTMQSFCGNYENTIVSVDPEIVNPHIKHFDYLWGQFLPASEVPWGNEPHNRKYVPVSSIS